MRTIRLRRAAELLREGERTINEITTTQASHLSVISAAASELCIACRPLNLHRNNVVGGNKVVGDSHPDLAVNV